MNLQDLGYTRDLEDYRNTHGYNGLGVGRVISEHKERYVVKTAQGELDAEILGSLRYTAQGRAGFPAVGDWVAISEYDDMGIIHAVFPRTSTLERQKVGRKGEKQIIATNIDVAFIVQAVDRDFSLNRAERYLTICNASNIKATILLNKIDLVEETQINQMMHAIQNRMKNVPALAISNESKHGIDVLKKQLQKGKTYCLLGSSGVGKSTLLNSLSDEDRMKTDTVSTYSNRGRHVTTHRELRILKNGAMLIDNPGMREVGITDASGGLEATFEKISELSKECKFKDCTHTSELGCAVTAALDRGDLDASVYENYLKMEREKEHFEATVAEKRKKDKAFGKMVKQFKKNKN